MQIIQMTATPGALFALDSAGNLWWQPLAQGGMPSGARWQEMPAAFAGPQIPDVATRPDSQSRNMQGSVSVRPGAPAGNVPGNQTIVTVIPPSPERKAQLEAQIRAATKPPLVLGAGQADSDAPVLDTQLGE